MCIRDSYDLADESVRLCVRTMEALLTDQLDPQQALAAAATADMPADRPVAGSGAAGFAKIL